MVVSMKIGAEDASGYADAANFTFPINPKIVGIKMDTQRQVSRISYQQIHTLVDSGGLEPKMFVLNGYFAGANRDTDMNTFLNHIYSAGMKRFYIGNDRFYYVFGGGANPDYQGGRTNFRDYTAVFITPIPFAYRDTASTETWSISTATATTINSSNDSSLGEGAFKNSGSAPAHILQWTITNGAAGANITKVEIGDLAVSGSAVQGNKIEWNGTLTATQVLKIFLFKLVGTGTGGITILKQLYYTVNDVFSGARDFDGKEAPFITAGATDQSFSVKLTGNSVASTVKADWRYAYWI